MQVRDPQEVFDNLAKPFFQTLVDDLDETSGQMLIEHIYQTFVLGEMYGTISTCLAQNIPIPKKMWDMPVVQSFVRGDVDDVIVVDERKDLLEQVADIVRTEMPDMSIEVIS